MDICKIFGLEWCEIWGFAWAGSILVHFVSAPFSRHFGGLADDICNLSEYIWAVSTLGFFVTYIVPTVWP